MGGGQRPSFIPTTLLSTALSCPKLQLGKVSRSSLPLNPGTSGLPTHKSPPCAQLTPVWVARAGSGSRSPAPPGRDGGRYWHVNVLLPWLCRRWSQLPPGSYWKCSLGSSPGQLTACASRSPTRISRTGWSSSSRSCTSCGNPSRASQSKNWSQQGPLPGPCRQHLSSPACNSEQTHSEAALSQARNWQLRTSFSPAPVSLPLHLMKRQHWAPGEPSPHQVIPPPLLPS